MVESNEYQKCVTVGINRFNHKAAILADCDEKSGEQKWKFENYVEKAPDKPNT